MAEEEPKPLNYIPEVILKKRKSNEEWAIRRKEQLEQRMRKSKGDNFTIKKPEQFIREYRDKELGKYGIVGMEDIVNEVATVGHHFKEVSHFLCPFNTQRARKGIAGKEKAF
ncbi:hypothetical protein U1Q18_044064 [Sarracenia purpurea var. burkii]